MEGDATEKTEVERTAEKADGEDADEGWVAAEEANVEKAAQTTRALIRRNTTTATKEPCHSCWCIWYSCREAWATNRNTTTSTKKTPTHITYGDNHDLSMFDPFSTQAERTTEKANWENADVKRAAAEEANVEKATQATRALIKRTTTTSTKEPCHPCWCIRFSCQEAGVIKRELHHPPQENADPHHPL